MTYQDLHPLHRAAREGDVATLLSVLDSKVDVNIRMQDSDFTFGRLLAGASALHLAADRGRDECMSLLMERKAALEATTAEGLTALHVSALARHPHLCCLLLDAQANVNNARALPEARAPGSTALLYAARVGSLDCVKLLTDRKADLDAATSGGDSTALHEAVANDDLEIVRHLLDAKAAIDKQTTDTHDTPLILAVLNDARESMMRLRASTVRLLLDKGSANKTALEWARTGHCPATVRLLESVREIVWSPATHRHYSCANDKSRVLALLILHRTRLSSSSSPEQRIEAFHADANNRFFTLPLPLLFRILSFAAPFLRWMAPEEEQQEEEEREDSGI